MHSNNEISANDNQLLTQHSSDKEEEEQQQQHTFNVDILSKVLIVQTKHIKTLNTAFHSQLNQKLQQFIDNYNYSDLPVLSNKQPLPQECYTKYIKIFDQTFKTDDNEFNPYEKIQFTKYLNTIPFIHYHHNQDMSLPNESLFRCFQMICAHHIIETKLNMYISNNLTFNDLVSLNNEAFNLNERKWLLIDRSHMNYFKAELIALFCNTPLPLEVISNNSYYQHFITKLPQLLLSLNNNQKNIQSFSLQKIHSPFGQEVYLKMINDINDFNNIEQMITIFNDIYEQFNIFNSKTFMKMFFFNYAIDERKIISECFNKVKCYSRMEKYYKTKIGKYYELKKDMQCVIIVEGSIIEENGEDYLAEFFNIKCNRGFICKAYKSSALYLYAIGVTEDKKVICVDPEKQNDKCIEQVYNFLVNDKAKGFVVSDMESYSITKEKVCCVDFRDLAEETYFVFEFKALDEYKELVNGIVKYCSKTELKQFELNQISNKVECDDNDKNSTCVMVEKINRNLSLDLNDLGEEI